MNLAPAHPWCELPKRDRLAFSTPTNRTVRDVPILFQIASLAKKPAIGVDLEVVGHGIAALASGKLPLEPLDLVLGRRERLTSVQH